MVFGVLRRQQSSVVVQADDLRELEHYVQQVLDLRVLFEDVGVKLGQVAFRAADRFLEDVRVK